MPWHYLLPRSPPGKLTRKPPQKAGPLYHAQFQIICAIMSANPSPSSTQHSTTRDRRPPPAPHPTCTNYQSLLSPPNHSNRTKPDKTRHITRIQPANTPKPDTSRQNPTDFQNPTTLHNK